eukprot:Opistho-1_new@106696
MLSPRRLWTACRHGPRHRTEEHFPMKHLLESLFSPRRRALVAALAGSLTAAVSLAQAPAPAPSAAPIRIGMIEGLSGPFANTGEAVFRNLVWATERVNAPCTLR